MRCRRSRFRCSQEPLRLERIVADEKPDYVLHVVGRRVRTIDLPEQLVGAQLSEASLPAGSTRSLLALGDHSESPCHVKTRRWCPVVLPAVIRSWRWQPAGEAVKDRSDVEIWTVHESNQDEMPEQIVRWLRARGLR